MVRPSGKVSRGIFRVVVADGRLVPHSWNATDKGSAGGHLGTGRGNTTMRYGSNFIIRLPIAVHNTCKSSYLGGYCVQLPAWIVNLLVPVQASTQSELHFRMDWLVLHEPHRMM